MLSELRPGQRRTVSEAEQGRTTLWRRFRGILHGGSAEPLAFCCPNWLFENLIWTGVVGDLPHGSRLTTNVPATSLPHAPASNTGQGVGRGVHQQVQFNRGSDRRMIFFWMAYCTSWALLKKII